MKQIPLTQGLEALVDDEDYVRVVQRKWYAAKRCNGFYAARGNKRDGFFYLHRFILDAKPGQLVDHKNGNSLDNRRENLRFVTPQQNTWNKNQTRARSGAVGVVYDPFTAGYPRSKPWRACIDVAKGRRRHIGWFKTKEEAITARRALAQALRGAYAGVA